MLRAKLNTTGCPRGPSRDARPGATAEPGSESGGKPAPTPVPPSGNRNDELLAAGVQRMLAGTRYTIAAPGYARLTRPLRRLSLPRHLPQGLATFVSSPAGAARESDGRAGGAAAGPIQPPAERAEAPAIESIVLFDIESLGFIGRPLFLIGAVYGQHAADGLWDLEMVQYLARDYSEEEAILAAFHEDASGADLCVTFNGRTFDLPFLALRAAYFQREPYHPRRHLDLLPVARHCWGARLPNCRLKTLEHLVCGRPRAGLDIDSSRVPEAYHRFVRTGEPFELMEVLGHNAADLISLLELHERAATELAGE
jgi:uncharacterized protein YprB with RNaseH-like and TPR domain